MDSAENKYSVTLDGYLKSHLVTLNMLHQQRDADERTIRIQNNEEPVRYFPAWHKTKANQKIPIPEKVSEKQFEIVKYRLEKFKEEIRIRESKGA